METTLKVIFGSLTAAVVLVVIAVVSIPMVMFSAYIGQDLWGMFILPLTGLAVPNLWTMAGLSVVVGYFKGFRMSDIKPNKDKDKKSETPVWDMIEPFMYQLLFLLIVWGEGHLFFWLSQ